MLLENCKIVMVGTTHPGNIGAAARAMRNMCFERLALVDPRCAVDESAYARASGADVILDNLERCETLRQAVADCHYVIATSARRRSLAWPELAPAELGARISGFDDESRVALVFGREHSGLTNDELQLCNYMVCIPTNPEFSSLNVAAAIQLLCYEVFRHQAGPSHSIVQEPQEAPATNAELEDFFEHLWRVLETTQFLDPEQPRYIKPRLRRLFLRAGLSRHEVNILRGILAAVDKSRA